MKSLRLSFQYDIQSSIIVFLVALPLCLGIALACDMPLHTGILAGVIGGIVVGWLSDSALSVSGPAAGLTAIILTAKSELSSVEALFMAIFIAGLIQILLGYLKSGVFAYYFPSNVINGMLAAIGIIIIMKQIPHAVGWDKDSEGDFSFLQIDGENTFTEIWNSVGHIDLGVMIIAIVGLGILFLWANMKNSFLKNIPAGLIVVFFGIGCNLVYGLYAPSLAIKPEHLVQLPSIQSLDEFFGLFTMPNFNYLTNMHVYVHGMIIAAVASIETLLCIEAVDKLDPLKRTTNANRELVAQGIGNSILGLIGGLPMTSVVVRSSANIDAGAKSKWSAIFHGFLLFFCFLCIPSVLNRIPLGSLAAILIYTGYKLANPKLFIKLYKQGIWQFVPFIVTVVAIIFTDLLKGVGLGMCIGILFILLRNIKNPINYIDKKRKENNIIKIELNSELSFLNKAKTMMTFSSIPENSKIVLDARKTLHIDFDVLEELKEFIHVVAPSKNIQITTVGFRTGFGIKNTESIYDQILGKDVDEDKLEVHSKELQQKITPQKALELMKEGNFRFVNNLKLNRDILEQVNQRSDNQYPYAVVLSCIDSRTSAELIFDKGMGDLFSIRIAGNVLNEDILGSMEFGCNVVGSKLIVVLGHSKCGAIKGACDHVEMGNLTHLIQKIKPAVDLVSEQLGIKPTSKDASFVEAVSLANIKIVKNEITQRSPILKQLEQDGKILIVAANYDVETGLVEFFEEE